MTTPFDQLHPVVQYHIVNSIGWPKLREIQESCIGPILAGENLIVLAQTAGGKTEAAFFPLMSRLLTEQWNDLSILYISPIRALLNNQESRLAQYFELIGRRAATWHGDVTASAKKRLLKAIPNCLLTTPESLEAMLCSRKLDHRTFFSSLRAVVIDEVHAFAGDDRGWHLLSVLSRLSRVCGRPIQRVGLSATVGNPDELAAWLDAGCGTGGRVIKPTLVSNKSKPEVKIDYVGNLENAAKVISRLHQGEKRLVFCDSRALVEQLAATLQGLGIRTFVTHSSLSRDLRLHAEAAFAQEKDCVICATSALELGIDIGDLDRVIQINSPGSVASFLQRMGRTGRRAGTVSNCLFLALDEAALLDCATLVEMWEHGYVEPILPPPVPYHIFAQQVMALALQTGGLKYGDWDRWLDRVPCFVAMSADEKEQIVRGMVEKRLLFNDNGILWFDEEGEKQFGRKNFLELLSVFTAAPMMTVLNGRTELGVIDLSPFLLAASRDDQQAPQILTLSGRDWQVVHIDWKRRQVFVERSAHRGRSRWLGSGRTVSFAFAQAQLGVLTGLGSSPRWSKRAIEGMDEIRIAHAWARTGTLILRPDGRDRYLLWTFAGTRANALLGQLVAQITGKSSDARATAIRLEWKGSAAELIEEIKKLTPSLSLAPELEIADSMIDALKFSTCLSPKLAKQCLSVRNQDRVGTDYAAKAAIIGFIELV